MPADAGLFRCSDPAVWRGVHEKYWAVVETKSTGKGKAGKLLALDKWCALVRHTYCIMSLISGPLVISMQITYKVDQSGYA